MSETDFISDDRIDAVLEGGPADIPSASRRHRVRPDHDRIKVPHRGGYEHFERAVDTGSGSAAPVVYRWVTRTRIAE